MGLIFLRTICRNHFEFSVNCRNVPERNLLFGA
jgi:hypothetical protein